jgi:CDP-6-deoxy-D-xylo-4-hexulose-3-dehydrase
MKSEFDWPLQKNSLSFMDRLKLAKFVLTTDKFTQGKKVEEFEREWSWWLGGKHSLFVSSGSTANFLLIAALIATKRLNKGDKVVVPACTWVTNINPIIQLGLQPIFCDIDLHNYSFDLHNLKYISEKHTDIKAVFVTHLLGIPAPVHLFKKILPNAIYIDDVCESHGCVDHHGDLVGSRSTGATFSFYFGHHMSTIEGGMITTNDTELYNAMRMMRSHGMSRNALAPHFYNRKYPDIEKQFLFVLDGYNFRNTELAAVLGLSQLKKLDCFIKTRRDNHEVFYNIVEGRQDLFYPVNNTPNNSSFCFPLICRSKEIKQDLIKTLNENSIEYRPIVGGNLLRQPYLKESGYKIESDKNGNFNVDILHENGVYIGNNQFVHNADMDMLGEILWSM